MISTTQCPTQVEEQVSELRVHRAEMAIKQEVRFSTF